MPCRARSFPARRHVIAIDPNEWKRDQAIKFGATHVYPSMAEAIAPVIDVTHGIMADKTIIAVGDMRGEYVEEAMILTAKTGTCVVTGMGSMMDVDVKLNLFLFTMLQKTLKGNIFGGGSSHVETPKLVGLYKAGLLKIDEMVTSHLSARRHQPGICGHARGQEHPRRHHVRRIGLVASRASTASVHDVTARTCASGIPSNTTERTKSAWPGAAARSAFWPSSVRSTVAPRRSSPLPCRTTRPRSRMRRSWWDKRLCSHANASARS